MILIIENKIKNEVFMKTAHLFNAVLILLNVLCFAFVYSLGGPQIAIEHSFFGELSTFTSFVSMSYFQMFYFFIK